jgi:hypothetical protein
MAQTTVNPTVVSFAASADHSATGLDGAPLVARYELRMFLVNGGAALVTQDIGKPVPTSGTITVTNPVWFAGLTKNTVYVAKVAAIGPSGEGVSDNSNPFGNAGPPAKPGAPSLK